MKKIILLLGLISHFAQAAGGTNVGNGGDAVVCPNADGTLRAELLDFYESRERRHIPFDLGAPTLSVAEKVNLALTRLAVHAPRWAAKLKVSAESFLANHQSYLSRGVELTDIPDSNEVAVPVNCEKHQIAIRSEPMFPEDLEFTINGDLWDLMDNDNKAGLVLHELLYKDFKTPDSRPVRYFNSMLATEHFVDLSIKEYLDLLISVRAPQMEFASGVVFKPYVADRASLRLRLFDDGNPRSGILAYPQDFLLAEGPRRFSDFVRLNAEGKLVSALIDSQRFVLQGSSVPLKDWVEFSDSGTVTGGALGEAYSYSDPWLTMNCTAEQVRTARPNFRLDDAGNLLAVRDCGFMVSSQLKIIEISLGEWTRHETTGTIKSASVYYLGFRNTDNSSRGFVSIAVTGITTIDLASRAILSTHLAETRNFPVGSRSVSFAPGLIYFSPSTGNITKGILSTRQVLMGADGSEREFSAGAQIEIDDAGVVQHATEPSVLQ